MLERGCDLGPDVGFNHRDIEEFEILIMAAPVPNALPKLYTSPALCRETGIRNVFQFSISVRDMVILVDERVADRIEQECRNPGVLENRIDEVKKRMAFIEGVGMDEAI